MTRRAALTMLPIAALAMVPGTARAWEPETTHAGLAEQAALASRLHKRLVMLGFTGGLFEPLTIPPADAPTLMQALKLLSPSHGSVPDARGRQVALGWLAAGAALADVPAAHGANHFYDPSNRRGWQAPSRDAVARLTDAIRGALGRAALPDRGIPAPDWVVAKDNPFNYDAFATQYIKAITAPTPGERSRHMAATLVAAGAILHVLGDLGAPSRVRGDEAAHLEPLGAGPDDLGSRFERIAALAFGRLGVPAPSTVITRTKLREFFAAADAAPSPKLDIKAGGVTGGLADVIARSYFSPNTLPASTRVGDETRPALARPAPTLPSRLNLMAASREDGTVLRDVSGTCLARYQVEHGVVGFTIDDECMLEQVTAILPLVASYETGLLDFLLRGELAITVGSSVVISGKGLGAGTIDVLAEDDRGVRTRLTSVPVTAGTEELARLAAPAGITRVVAVYRGVDAGGEPLVAVGAMPMPR